MFYIIILKISELKRMKQMNKNVILCAVLFLSACGGSGSGEQINQNKVKSNNNANCSNSRLDSCYYDVNQLSLNVMFSKNNTGTLNVSASVSGPKQDIFFTGSDVLEIHADGEVLLPANNGANRLIYENIPDNAQIYEFFWYRNSQLIEYNSIDGLTEPSVILSTNQHDGTNTITTDWLNNPDYTYQIHTPSLWCTNLNNESEMFSPSTELLDNQRPPYQATLQALYGKNIENLKINYRSCDISVTLIAKNNQVNYRNKQKRLFIHHDNFSEHPLTLFESN
ncbi:hypothetical protein Q4491_14430 [Photobacterium sp. 2_MG-2023]|uniref:hypothetical protein n=1 Tax=Photobacterium sp. 2_MG-2023 TaxID=3062663 RepID=UPI0026E2C3BD|nr:hypothetical protein [Photobacterium sp. 2_MG-2023]MDO6582540.1 hypothetical protein [Photobacterium sp. 2_MG-2023]